MRIEGQLLFAVAKGREVAVDAFADGKPQHMVVRLPRAPWLHPAVQRAMARWVEQGTALIWQYRHDRRRLQLSDGSTSVDLDVIIADFCI